MNNNQPIFQIRLISYRILLNESFPISFPVSYNMQKWWYACFYFWVITDQYLFFFDTNSTKIDPEKLFGVSGRN